MDTKTVVVSEDLKLEAYTITGLILKYRRRAGKIPKQLTEDMDELHHEAYARLVLPNLKHYNPERGKLITFVNAVLSGRPLFLLLKRTGDGGIVAAGEANLGNPDRLFLGEGEGWERDEGEHGGSLQDLVYEEPPEGLEIPGCEKTTEEELTVALVQQLPYVLRNKWQKYNNAEMTRSARVYYLKQLNDFKNKHLR